MRVIAVVGLPASGKGEFSRLAGEMKIPVIVMGDVVRKAVQDAGLPLTDNNMGEMSCHLREGLGRDALAQLVIPEIQAQTARVVLVDGIRSDAEVETLRRNFPDFVLTGLDVPFDIRLARLGGRGRADDTIGTEGLRMRDERELGWGMGKALEMADHTLRNEGSVSDFETEVRGLLKKLRAGV